MKRQREEASAVCPSLPSELVERILCESGSPLLGLVSYAWYKAVTDRNTTIDWFAVLVRDAAAHLDDVLHFTGSGVTAETRHQMTLGAYLDEVEWRFTYEHLLCGMRQRLSLFMVYALSIYVRQRDNEASHWVNRTCLLQSALYFLRDVAHKPLAARHFHPRDFRINFFEEGHTYLLALRLKGRWQLATNIKSAVAEVMSEELTSTTTMIHDLFEPFVEDVVAERMVRSRKHTNAEQRTEYYGLSVADIKAKWAEARRLGTAWHYNLECYCNGLEYETECKEWELFQAFETDSVFGCLVPYRTEWLMYDEELRLTGSDDIIFQDVAEGGLAFTPDGARVLHMADWKRANDLMKENAYECGSKPCTEDMQDCKISHYRVQLLIYTVLLERNYGVFVARRSIVGMHPSKATHDKYDVPYEAKRVHDLIAYRRQWLKDRQLAREKNVLDRKVSDDGRDNESGS